MVVGNRALICAPRGVKSPVGSSGSNGVVRERGVQSVEGSTRTLLSACQKRLYQRIKLEEKMMISVAGFAAYLSIDRKSARLAGMRVIDVAENAQQSYGHRVWWGVRWCEGQERGGLGGTKQVPQVLRSVRRIFCGRGMERDQQRFRQACAVEQKKREKTLKQTEIFQVVADGRFCVTRMAGVNTPADILTKYKGLRDFKDKMMRVNVQFGQTVLVALYP